MYRVLERFLGLKELLNDKERERERDETRNDATGLIYDRITLRLVIFIYLNAISSLPGAKSRFANGGSKQRNCR